MRQNRFCAYNPRMTGDDVKKDLLRHFLATLAYRARKAVTATSEEFGTFDAGHGVRKPVEIISHMSGVLMHASSFLKSCETTAGPIGRWQAEVERFFGLLSELDELFKSRVELRGRSEEQILQGPLADAMTHVGQLAILRRMASLPIPKENFDEAVIRIGDVGLEPME
jgi:hypothetical protein